MTDSAEKRGKQYNFTIRNDTDIYTKAPIVTQSPEHLVQSGLGSPVCVTGLIDHSTNNKFGGTIDRIFLESMQGIRAHLGGKTSMGESLTARTSDNQYEMRDGKPELIIKKEPGEKPWDITDEGVSGVKIHLETTSTEKLPQIAILAAHAIRANVPDKAEIKNLETTNTRTKTPPLPFRAKLSGHGFEHAIAKSLFNITADYLSPQTVLSSEFDMIRAYVLSGITPTEKPSSIIPLCGPDTRYRLKTDNFDKYPLLCTYSIRGCWSTSCIYGLVTLFGHYHYSCLIADNWTGAGFLKSLSFDPDQHASPNWWEFEELPPSRIPSLDAGQVMHRAFPTRKELDAANLAVQAAVQTMLDDSRVSRVYAEQIKLGIPEEVAMKYAIEDLVSWQSGSSPEIGTFRLNDKEMRDKIDRELEKINKRKNRGA